MGRGSLVALSATAAVVLIAVLLEWPTWLRLPLVAVWLLIVPGWTWARRFDRFDAGDRIAVGIALSATMLTIVAAVMALTAAWSPLAALIALTLVAFGGALVPVRRSSMAGQPDADSETSEGDRR